MGTKEKILVAAAAAFADKGYHAATIRDICAGADVNVASVNYHFSSKSHLYEKVFEYLLLKTEKVNAGSINTNIDSEKAWRTEIKRFIHRMLKRCTSEDRFERYLYVLFAREEMNPSDNFPGIYKTLLASRLADIKTLFSYGDVENEIQLNICVLSIIAVLLNFSERRVLIRQFTGSDDFGRANFDLIADNIIDGITKTIKWKDRHGG